MTPIARPVQTSTPKVGTPIWKQQPSLAVRRSGQPLSRLKVGDRGVITQLQADNPRVAQRLQQRGITPGRLLTVEQRFPRFIVRIGCHSLPLDARAIQAIQIAPQSL